MSTPHTNQASVTISSSTTSASGTIPAAFTKTKIRVLNLSSAAAYVRTGITTPTAVTTDQFIGPNETVILEKPIADHLIAVILTSGTGSLIAAPV